MQVELKTDLPPHPLSTFFKENKNKTDQDALCSTTEIIGFKTFLKLFCSEIISA